MTIFYERGVVFVSLYWMRWCQKLIWTIRSIHGPQIDQKAGPSNLDANKKRIGRTLSQYSYGETLLSCCEMDEIKHVWHCTDISPRKTPGKYDKLQINSKKYVITLIILIQVNYFYIWFTFVILILLVASNGFGRVY